MGPRLASFAAAAAATFCASAATAAYTSVVVFGDSLSDGGNGYYLNTAVNPGPGAALGYLMPSNLFEPPYPAGTTKNTNPGGQVAVEVMAAAIGNTLSPSTAGGTNFAVSGATSGSASFAHDGFQAAFPTASDPVVPFFPGLKDSGVQTQVGQYLGLLGGAAADPNALYVVWAGPNDVFLAGVTGAPPDPVGYVANILGAVLTLYGAGARNFLVPNMPDLGSIPATLGTPAAAGLTFVTTVFNAVLAAGINGLVSDPGLPDLDIIPFDTFATLAGVLANPAAFGFDNVTQGCNDVGPAVCTDPSRYLFWDAVHPSAAGHAILGSRFASAVPEPPGLLLLAAAVIGFALGRRPPRCRKLGTPAER